MEKKVALMEFESNPNIGLYIFANNKLCLVGKDLEEKRKKEIENTLQVPVYNISILGTELAGVFICGNDDFILIPDCYDYEEEELKEICKKHDIELKKISSKINTLGNNICISDKFIIVSKSFDSKKLEEIAKKKKLKITKIPNIEKGGAGSIIRYANSKFFVSQELDEKDVEEFIDEIGSIGTINSGSIFVSSGIIANSNGLIIGKNSTSIEIQNIVEGLDFL